MTANIKRIQVTQIILLDEFVKTDEHGFISVHGDAINMQVDSALACAKKNNVQLLVFPELAIPRNPKLRSKFRAWTKNNDAVIVAASYYDKKRRGHEFEVTPASPVFVRGEETLVPKCCTSPLEKPAKENIHLQLGTSLTVIKNTPAGNIGIAICSDIFDETIQKQIKANADLDILCVPAMQKDPRIHFRSLAELCRHATDGMFVVYSNSLWNQHSRGGSSFFGLLHRTYSQKLKELQMSERTDHEEHLLQLPDCAKNLVVSVDLSMRRPVQANSVKDTSPVKVVYGDFAYDSMGNRFLPVQGEEKQSRIKIVAFDADGTLIRGIKFSWQLLWNVLYGAEGDKLREKFRDEYKNNVERNPENRQRHYENWCKQCCVQFKQKKLTRDQIVSLSKSLKPADSLIPALERIKNEIGCRLILVSGGLDLISKTALGKDAWDLFDKHYINVMSFTEEGLLNHIEPTHFDYQGKYDALLKEAILANCLPANVAFIGDEHNDRYALKRIHSEGGLAIAFGKNTCLSQEEVSKVVVTDDLMHIVDEVASRNSGGGSSGRASSETRVRRRYPTELYEKGNELRDAQAILRRWVESLSLQPQSNWLGKVKHDQGHRKRVLSTVLKLIHPEWYSSSNSQHLAFLADCAVTVHDIGLQLAIEDYIPGADLYPPDLRARLAQRLHHNVSSNVLRRISEGRNPTELDAILANSTSRNNVEPKAINVLRDLCRILSEMNAFHDANEEDLLGVHAELNAVLSDVSWFKAYPEDVNYLAAVIRFADRLDRHHKRFKDSREAERLCTHWSSHYIDADVPGVVIDSAVVASCEVITSRNRHLSVQYTPPNFRNKQATEVAHSILSERVLPRIRQKRPWYIQQIERQVSLTVAEPELSRDAIHEVPGDVKRAAPPTEMDKRFQLSSVVLDILNCTPVDSWLKSIIGKNVVCGGAERSLPNKDHASFRPEVIFDIDEWGITDLSRPFVMESRQNVIKYRESGGVLNRLKDLAPSEASEWDVYVPLSNKNANEYRMLLNAHIPARLRYSREQAREYMNMLARDVRPYTIRLFNILKHQNKDAMSLIEETCGTEAASKVSRLQIGEDVLSTIDLSVIVSEMCECSGYSIVSVGYQPTGTPLLPGMQAPISGAVYSSDILRLVCTAASDALNRLGACNVVLEEHQSLPINIIRFATDIVDEYAVSQRKLLELFVDYCRSAEVFIPDLDGSELSIGLRKLHSLARLAGIGIRSNFFGSKFEIAFSVIARGTRSGSKQI